MNLVTQEARPHADDTRLIPLTQGQFAIVDAPDYDWLNQWKWYAKWNKGTGSFYALRASPRRFGKQQTIAMHREILGLLHGDRRTGDHKEPSRTLDNRRVNLRIATPSEQMHNRYKDCRNTSGYKGVTWSQKDQVWVAKTSLHGKCKWIGHFNSKLEAALAYDAFVIKEHGKFARPNFPT